MVDADTDAVIQRLRNSRRSLRFAELARICDRYFGPPRQRGSHLIYPVPWPGDPRVNIQNRRGMAKPEQVNQVVKAIERLVQERGENRE